MRKLKNYKPTKFMNKDSTYNKDADDFAVSFIECLCHTKGNWAGKPFELIDWQEQIVRDFFGVLKPNGYHQFNTAYKVQKIMDKRRDGFTVPNGTRHKYSNKYCFSCIVYCGHCKDIYCRNIWYTDGRKPVWRCYTRRNFNHRRGRGRRCPGRNVLEKDLEQATLMAFNQLIRHHHLADKQINQNIMKVINNTDGPTLDEIEAQLDRAQKQLLETATMGDDYQELIDHIKSFRQQQTFLSNQQVDHAVQKDSLGEIQKLFEEHQNGLLGSKTRQIVR